MENKIMPKRYRAKTNHTKKYLKCDLLGHDMQNQYVQGYYVFLPLGNVHHWIVYGGRGNGGWFCPHVASIDINTLEEI